MSRFSNIFIWTPKWEYKLRKGYRRLFYQDQLIDVSTRGTGLALIGHPGYKNEKVSDLENILMDEGDKTFANAISFALSSKVITDNVMVGNGSIRLHDYNACILANPAVAKTPAAGDKGATYNTFTAYGDVLDVSGTKDSMMQTFPLQPELGIPINPEVPNPWPTVNDTDLDNTSSGVDVITWIFNYPAAWFKVENGVDANIKNGVITIWDGTRGTPPGAAVSLMSWFEFGSPFFVEDPDTLKVIYNAEVRGV